MLEENKFCTNKIKHGDFFVNTFIFAEFMAKDTHLILKPGMGVDLIFELNSISPRSKPSIIFDVMPKKKQIVIAQPTQRINPEMPIREMHISSLIRGEFSSKTRMGYKCRVVDAINGYQLANRSMADAIVIEYSEPALEINIRAAYRFHPNEQFDVMGKLSYNNEFYYSGRHFRFQNISINGVGLLIPKKFRQERNPLIDMQVDSVAKIGIILKYSLEEETIETLDCDLDVVRTNTNYNEKSGFAGCALKNLAVEHEEILNRFIHKAQVHEIRRQNRF